MCQYIVFLDNDEAGKVAAENAINRGLLDDASVKYTICNGQTSSEVEDCYNTDIYRQIIMDKFAVDINTPQFRGSAKWSDRMRTAFLSNAQQWNDAMEKKVKLAVATAVSENCADALNQHKRSSIDALIVSLERILT